ncbi:THO complex subunit 4A [Camellia lanceoleosa]|uniref:THO complex subunit 4A n=1 Tax=Camellia lanceoleosa TaxID=1840588 RepID=A0ACC0H473_9ERIC|nr:THO complex subunit 4A [Camellia lanceoleosa]
MKRYSIHYDRSGRSKDAMSTIKMYNNVQLDGKPMKIKIVGTNMATLAMPPAANSSFGNLNEVPRRYWKFIK